MDTLDIPFEEAFFYGRKVMNNIIFDQACLVEMQEYYPHFCIHIQADVDSHCE